MAMNIIAKLTQVKTTSPLMKYTPKEGNRKVTFGLPKCSKVTKTMRIVKCTLLKQGPLI